MAPMLLHAYWKLVEMDLCMTRREFAALYEKVRSCPVAPLSCAFSVTQICNAVDLACIWYPKEVLCLQRSAATACLLRKYAISAQLVIGSCQMPFRAHAWVEVDGRVVNDKPYTNEMYAVLDRC
jgi:hypothetical protein